MDTGLQFKYDLRTGGHINPDAGLHFIRPLRVFGMMTHDLLRGAEMSDWSVKMVPSGSLQSINTFEYRPSYDNGF